MAVAGRSWVEEVRDAELGGRSDVALALEEQNLVLEKGSADGFEVGACGRQSGLMVDVDLRMEVTAPRSAPLCTSNLSLDQTHQ